MTDSTSYKLFCLEAPSPLKAKYWRLLFLIAGLAILQGIKGILPGTPARWRLTSVR